MQKKKKRFLAVCELQALTEFDPIALKLSKQLTYRNEFDDLYQISKIAIIEAIRTFDPNKGVKLSTHVFVMILSSLRKFDTKNHSLIYQPYYTKNKFKRIDYDELDLYCSENKVDETEIKIVLNDCFECLTDKQKLIIKLNYVDGYSITEIAKMLNCSHQNISKLNNKAIKSVQKLLTT